MVIDIVDYLDEFKKKGFHGTVSVHWTFYDGEVTKIKKGVEESLDRNSKEFKELNK